MVNILSILFTTLIICVVGGGGAYLIWLWTRPKKEVWPCRVYQLSEGIREPKTDSNGKVISSIRLNDLRPYTKDIIEKIVKDHGIIIYRLKKLNKPVPEVTGDVVEYWGEKNKEVSVLLHNGACTLLKKGYHKETGELVFDPLPHNRISLVTNQIAIRKDRLTKEKDLLQALTPMIVTGIAIVGLIIVSFIMVKGFVEISENMKVASENFGSQVCEGISNALPPNKASTGVINIPNDRLVDPITDIKGS